MPAVFLDTDVIIDVLAERHPFYGAAATVMTLVEEQEVAGYTSSLVFANLYYILRRLRDRETALTSLKKLHAIVRVLPVDDQCIARALDAAFSDFEDAIQYHTALQHQMEYLLTRNTRDYQNVEQGRLTVCTAEEYLHLWLER